MGWMDALVNGLVGAGNIAYQVHKDKHLTGAQREANEFSAQQAEIARDWQEHMYNQYESPQARIRQYEAAGLNPALMYGDATGGNMPNASAPSSVSPQGGDINGAIAQLIGLKKSIAEIDNIRSQTTLNEEKAKTEGVGRDKIASEIGLLAEQTKTESEKQKLIAVQSVVEGLHGDLYAAQTDLTRVEELKNTEEGKIIKSNADYLIEHGFTREQAAQVICAVILGAPQYLNLIGGAAGKLLGKVFGKEGPKTIIKQTKRNKDGKVTFEEVTETTTEFIGEQ